MIKQTQNEREKKKEIGSLQTTKLGGGLGGRVAKEAEQGAMQ